MTSVSRTNAPPAESNDAAARVTVTPILLPIPSFHHAWIIRHDLQLPIGRAGHAVVALGPKVVVAGGVLEKTE